MSDFSDPPLGNVLDHSTERLQKTPGAYRTISEVAEELHIPQHRLRAWETMYPVIKPFRGESGRRYYSPEAIDTIRQISDILYVQGYRGHSVMRVLQERSRAKTQAGSAVSASTVSADFAGIAPEEEPLKAEPTVKGQDDAAAVIVSGTDARSSADDVECAEPIIPPSVAEQPVEGKDAGVAVSGEAYEKLRSDNDRLRSELREILEELQNLRNLLSI